MTNTHRPRSLSAAARTRNRAITAIDLLDAARVHLCQFEIPEPWTVKVTTGQADRDIDVQLHCLEPSEVATELLAWADTLTEVTVEAWRPPQRDTVHLSVTGRLAHGAVLRVFAGIPYREHGIGADLHPGTATTLRFSALRLLANPGQVA